jgi:hypothetical protein
LVCPEMAMTQQYDPKLAASVTATAQQILMPMIRQVYPALIAQSILGVQPMTGSVGEIFTMKARYKQQPKYQFSRARWYDADHHYDDYDAVIAWCTEHFGPRPRHPDAWTRWCDIHIDRIRFRDEKDYNWFVLRWGA